MSVLIYLVIVLEKERAIEGQPFSATGDTCWSAVDLPSIQL